MTALRELADLCAEAERALAGELKRPLADLRADLVNACTRLHRLAGLLEAEGAR